MALPSSNKGGTSMIHSKKMKFSYLHLLAEEEVGKRIIRRKSRIFENLGKVEKVNETLISLIPKIYHLFQSNFITNNIIIVYEVFHSIRHRKGKVKTHISDSMWFERTKDLERDELILCAKSYIYQVDDLGFSHLFNVIYLYVNLIRCSQKNSTWHCGRLYVSLKDKVFWGYEAYAND
ncbi:hypothetical protein CR513_44965, partial [Mucuna pruriens]